MFLFVAFTTLIFLRNAMVLHENQLKTLFSSHFVIESLFYHLQPYPSNIHIVKYMELCKMGDVKSLKQDTYLSSKIFMRGRSIRCATYLSIKIYT